MKKKRALITDEILRVSREPGDADYENWFDQRVEYYQKRLEALANKINLTTKEVERLGLEIAKIGPESEKQFVRAMKAWNSFSGEKRARKTFEKSMSRLGESERKLNALRAEGERFPAEYERAASEFENFFKEQLSKAARFCESIGETALLEKIQDQQGTLDLMVAGRKIDDVFF